MYRDRGHIYGCPVLAECFEPKQTHCYSASHSALKHSCCHLVWQSSAVQHPLLLMSTDLIWDVHMLRSTGENSSHSEGEKRAGRGGSIWYSFLSLVKTGILSCYYTAGGGSWGLKPLWVHYMTNSGLRRLRVCWNVLLNDYNMYSNENSL